MRGEWPAWQGSQMLCCYYFLAQALLDYKGCREASYLEERHEGTSIAQCRTVCSIADDLQAPTSGCVKGLPLR